MTKRFVVGKLKEQSEYAGLYFICDTYTGRPASMEYLYQYKFNARKRCDKLNREREAYYSLPDAPG